MRLLMWSILSFYLWSSLMKPYLCDTHSITGVAGAAVAGGLQLMRMETRQPKGLLAPNVVPAPDAALLFSVDHRGAIPLAAATQHPTTSGSRW